MKRLWYVLDDDDDIYSSQNNRFFRLVPFFASKRKGREGFAYCELDGVDYLAD